MALTGGLMISSVDIYSADVNPQHNLGAVGVDAYGGCYRYTKFAGDESAGNLLVSKADEANHQNRALGAAASAGDTSVEVAVGATAVDADEYVGGFLSFVDVSPEGEGYRIVAHDASDGSENITVHLDRPLLTAATTSSEVALTHSPWNEPDTSTTTSLLPAGVVMVDIDQSEAAYGWLKTRGEAAVLGDTTGAGDGTIVTISDEDAGAVGLFSDVDAEPRVGIAMDASVDGEFFPVYLTID